VGPKNTKLFLAAQFRAKLDPSPNYMPKIPTFSLISLKKDRRDDRGSGAHARTPGRPRFCYMLIDFVGYAIFGHKYALNSATFYCNMWTRLCPGLLVIGISYVTVLKLYESLNYYIYSKICCSNLGFSSNTKTSIWP
jgi:hypothetical protein